MATKQQELEALDQIRKILTGLGEDSYLAFAFEGCLDDAEMNIADDAAYSYKARYEMETRKVENLMAHQREREEQDQNRMIHLQNEIKQLNETVDTLHENLKAEQEVTAQVRKSLSHATVTASDLKEAIRKKETDVFDRDQTIIELKAKLYDMMMKEAERC